jgi:flagellar export protein FliJ
MTTSPYAALLSLRRTEEQQAEIVLAEALREVTSIEKSIAQLRQTRVAWLEGRMVAGSGAPFEGLTDVMKTLETAEREAERRLAEAQTRAAAAREDVLERRRQRKVVERLHLELLAGEARANARRAQAELDELGSRSRRAFSVGR